MKKLSLKLVGILIIGVIVLQSTFVMAASTSDLKNQQSENNKKINETQEELNEIKEEKSETVKQVEQLSTQISQYQTQIDELDDKISELNDKIKDSEEKLNKKQEDYTKQEELLQARLVATYEAGDTSYLDVLLSSEGITDLISNYYLVTEVATNDTELIEKIQKEKEEIENAKAELESSKKDLDTSKASKQSITTQLQDSKKEKDSYVAKLSEDEKQTQSELDQLQADNDKIAKELKAAEARYQAQLEALRKKQQSSNNNNSSKGNNSSNSGDQYNSGGSGYLQRPVKSGSINTTMYYSSGKYHGAIDYGVPSGTTVYAAADGVVLKAASMSGSYGNYIVIQHTNGLRTWYAHGNGVFYVSAGQTVTKGQAIMQSGNSGNSSGPHLHFEVRVSPYSWYSGGNDSRRDPRNYM